MLRHTRPSSYFASGGVCYCLSDDDGLLVRASAVLKSQGPENRSRGRPGLLLPFCRTTPHHPPPRAPKKSRLGFTGGASWHRARALAIGTGWAGLCVMPSSSSNTIFLLLLTNHYDHAITSCWNSALSIVRRPTVLSRSARKIISSASSLETSRKTSRSAASAS